MYPTSDDPKVLRAFTHPLRVEIFDRLETRVASPSAIAIDLGQPVGTVAYHVRQLCDAGLLRLVDRRLRRGAIEHYYTGNLLPIISDERWGRIPVLLKRAIIGGALHRVGLQLEAAADHGTLDEDGSNVNRLGARLDSMGWTDVANELAATLLKIEGIGAETETRLTRNLEADSSDATVLIMLFQDPPENRASPGSPPDAPVPFTPEPIDIKDPRIHKAILHPLRVRLLEALGRSVASPSDMARELGTPLATTSYHVRQLESLGLIKLVKRTARRGALEHYYAATVQPVITGDGWAGAVDGATSHAVYEMGAHVLAAAQAGGFDGADIHYSRTTLRLDRDGRAEVGRELAALHNRLEDPVAKSEQRLLNRPPEEAILATVATMFFERPSSDPDGVQRAHDPAESLPPPAQ